MTVIAADSFFRIGKTHTICQDYAAHFTTRTTALAYLADGCSTATSGHQSDPEGQNSEVYTDFGARLLVLAAQQDARPCIQPIDQDDCSGAVARATTRAWQYTHNLGMSVNSLSATLLGLRLIHGDVRATVSGDGWLVGRRRDGRYRVIQVEYPSGAPYYLRYSLSSEDYNAYVKAFGYHYRVLEWDDWLPGQDWGEPVIRSLALPERAPTNNYFHYDQFEFPVDEFDLVLALSDGLSSFGQATCTSSSKTVDRVPEWRVLSVIVGCQKMVAGRFLQRNFGGPAGALKQFTREGWEHHDDFSVIGVYCDGYD